MSVVVSFVLSALFMYVYQDDGRDMKAKLDCSN